MINKNEQNHPFTVQGSRPVISQKLASHPDEQSNYLSDPLLLPKTVASILCVAVHTLSVWRSAGRYNLNFVKIGSKVLYRQSDVQAFIESCVVGK